MIKHKVYLDYAATTPVAPQVLKKMLPYFSDKFGNTMSLHSFGQEAKQALDASRGIIAQAIGAKPEEIIFTSSATESNNLALKGIAFANKTKGRHIIISSIEHHCIIESAQWLETQGFEITRLKVDKDGLVDPQDLEKTIRPDTILVSIMHANNEIGTIEPIQELGKICARRGVYFHTDASQTFGKLPINVKKMQIDLLTASSHKMYGPKGAALLFIKKGVQIEPIIHGGGHEMGLRSSTVNIPAIIGFSEAVKLCHEQMAKEAQREKKLRDKLIKGILKYIPGSHLNGHPTQRLANNINFWFDYVEGESIVFQLNSYGIAASTGSACSSPNLEPSHVLLAIGLKPGQAHGSLRLSLGRETKEQDIDYTLKVLPQIIQNLRKISPFKSL